MVGRRLIVLVFFLECISIVAVSAFPLSTTRKIESQPREELYARAAVERRRRWIDSERPFSPAHRMLRPPSPVLEQEITTEQPIDIEADPRTNSLTDNGLSKLTPAQLVRLYLLLLTNWTWTSYWLAFWRSLCSAMDWWNSVKTRILCFVYTYWAELFFLRLCIMNEWWSETSYWIWVVDCMYSFPLVVSSTHLFTHAGTEWETHEVFLSIETVLCGTPF